MPTLVAATQILWIVLPILLVRWCIRAGRRWAQEESSSAGAGFAAPRAGHVT